jgi:hypothetical protein
MLRRKTKRPSARPSAEIAQAEKALEVAIASVRKAGEINRAVAKIIAPTEDREEDTRKFSLPPPAGVEG